MGAAYFIVVNSQDPGFDTTVDGKALSRHARQIDAIAIKLGFKSLDEHCSQSPDDARLQMADLMGIEDEFDLPADAEETLKNMPPEEWYDASHGLDYANKVADHIRQNPTSVKDPDAVLYDLDTMITVLTEAASRGLQWHLQVDF
ncbi:MAG: hypothetical protein KDB05_27785 [Planctomycetales bacterium]|nr:hypothetical protein [Planctomycetales bacterium]